MLAGTPSSTLPPTAALSPDTLAERAAAVLQQAILAGDLAPDARLRIADLARQFGIGATPLREGLSRLVSHGLVLASGQRGFRVAPMSREDLEDIVRARTVIELEALRLAMAHGDDLWEAQIVACLHRMRRFTARSQQDFSEGVAEFDAVHKQFHTALIAACGSPRLLEMHAMLYDQAYRYRRVMMTCFKLPATLDDEHQELVDLVLQRQVEPACRKLAEHLASTILIVYPAGSDLADANKYKVINPEETTTHEKPDEGPRRRRAGGRRRV